MMINWDWITVSGVDVFMIILTGLGIFGVLILCTRLSGLRSFSKMSSFDFAVTVATGTVLGNTILTKDPPMIAGAVGLSLLFLMQFSVSKLRRKSSRFNKTVDNEPLLIMAGEKVLHTNMQKVRMSEEELNSKLRRNGITHKTQVFCVIMETTGDVTVIRSDSKRQYEAELFSDVRDAHMLKNLL